MRSDMIRMSMRHETTLLSARNIHGQASRSQKQTIVPMKHVALEKVNLKESEPRRTCAPKRGNTKIWPQTFEMKVEELKLTMAIQQLPFQSKFLATARSTDTSF